MTSALSAGDPAGSMYANFGQRRAAAGDGEVNSAGLRVDQLPGPSSSRVAENRPIAAVQEGCGEAAIK